MDTPQNIDDTIIKLEDPEDNIPLPLQHYNRDDNGLILLNPDQAPNPCSLIVSPHIPPWAKKMISEVRSIPGHHITGSITNGAIFKTPTFKEKYPKYHPSDYDKAVIKHKITANTILQPNDAQPIIVQNITWNDGKTHTVSANNS